MSCCIPRPCANFCCCIPACIPQYCSPCCQPCCKSVIPQEPLVLWSGFPGKEDVNGGIYKKNQLKENDASRSPIRGKKKGGKKADQKANVGGPDASGMPGAPGVGPGGQNVGPGGQNVGPGGQYVGPGGQYVGPGGQNVGPGAPGFGPGEPFFQQGRPGSGPGAAFGGVPGLPGNGPGGLNGGVPGLPGSGPGEIGGGDVDGDEHCRCCKRCPCQVGKPLNRSRGAKGPCRCCKDCPCHAAIKRLQLQTISNKIQTTSKNQCQCSNAEKDTKYALVLCSDCGHRKKVLVSENNNEKVPEDITEPHVCFFCGKRKKPSLVDNNVPCIQTLRLCRYCRYVQSLSQN